MNTLTLTVPDMACGACAETITKAVHGVDPQATVQADPGTKAVVIQSSVTPEPLKAAIAAAGYTVQ